ncbi:MAG TPA: hypothetical protein VFM18_23940 [Methanosarcina sp.]|nr:hypothetical protein [Methanosarcina sp.]
MWNLYTDGSHYICLFIDDDIIKKGINNPKTDEWWMPMDELEELTSEEDEIEQSQDSVTDWCEEDNISLVISNISIPITRIKYPELFI